MHVKYVIRMPKFVVIVLAAKDYEVVVRGVGICCFATALALHRKGITNILAKKSDGCRTKQLTMTR